MERARSTTVEVCQRGSIVMERKGLPKISRSNSAWHSLSGASASCLICHLFAEGSIDPPCNTKSPKVIRADDAECHAALWLFASAANSAARAAPPFILDMIANSFAARDGEQPLFPFMSPAVQKAQHRFRMITCQPFRFGHSLGRLRFENASKSITGKGKTEAGYGSRTRLIPPTRYHSS